MPATSLRFAAAARDLCAEARRLGLMAPGFRSPPRLPGADRSLRRRSGAAPAVAVRLRDRPEEQVLADMVDGVLAANRLTGDDATRCRAALRAAVGLDRLTTEATDDAPAAAGGRHAAGTAA